jgi:hypothetical protein
MKSGQTNSGSFKKGMRPWNRGLKGRQTAWNKDLTKDTDLRVKKISDALVGRAVPWVTGHVGPNKGRVICQEERLRISKSVRKARRTHSPIWNKGLTKKTHPSLRRMAKALSLSTKGKPRPFLSNRQGRRRFWYYGPFLRIRMRSRWEVAYAHWLDGRKALWIYEGTTFVNDEFSYTPDFYLFETNSFVEVKGWENGSYREKISALRTQWGVDVKILHGEDLQKLGILDEHNRVIAKGRRAYES